MSLSRPNEAFIADPAALLARGVARLLGHMGYGCLAEFRLRSGRRADVAGIDRKGRIVIVEIKSSIADFRIDAKWPEYLDYCDAFYFATHRGLPDGVLPEDQGLILADRFGAEVIRPAAGKAPLPAHRRREVTLRFALGAAQRLTDFTDPS
jgi:hypothetical protein